MYSKKHWIVPRRYGNNVAVRLEITQVRNFNSLNYRVKFFANMNNNWCRFLILYLLYYKHYTGKLDLHDTNAIIQEDDLQFVNNQLSIGEVIYLMDHGLIRGLNTGELYPPRIAIKSKGIDVIERILNQYLLYLKGRDDDQSQHEYKHVLAYPNDASKLSQLFFYIKQRRSVFEEYLSLSNIFERMTLGSAIPDIIPIRTITRERFLLQAGRIRANPLPDRIRKLEDQFMERKASFMYDKSINNRSQDLEKRISKAVAGLLNSEGGFLFIGVDDKGNVVGLSNDYQYVKRKNSDGFELELRNSINKYLRMMMVGDLEIIFHNLHNNEICEVVVKPSSIPVILYDKGQEFYVRIGNSTNLLDLKTSLDYCQKHFWTYNVKP